MSPPRGSRVPVALAEPVARGSGPRRTCVGCGTVRHAAELERLVLTGTGQLALGRHLAGRGAWLCRESLAECAGKAARTGRFARAFRRPVARPEAERFATELSSSLPSGAEPGPPTR